MIALPVAICLAFTPSPEELSLPPITAPELRTAASSAADFAPSGWTVERTVDGDLDKDGQADLVIVLKGADPACLVWTDLTDEPMDTNPRLLVVAFRRGGEYKLHSANIAVIPRREDPYTDDPLEIGGLEIRGGVVRLRLGHWRSMGGWGTYSNILSFRWDGKAFPLIGFDRDHLQRNTGETEKLSVNFLTGRARTVSGSMEDGVKDKVVWKNLADRQAPTLETIGNGLEFEPKL